MESNWTSKDKQVWKSIEALDLSGPREGLVKFARYWNGRHKLRMGKLSPTVWAHAAEKAYRRFLFIAYKYPRANLAPNTKIDAFWHQHILHTQQYTSDCQKVLGRFLHHRPESGGAKVAVTKKRRNFDDTQKLFKKEFGKPIDGKVQFCTNGGGGGSPCDVPDDRYP